MNLREDPAGFRCRGHPCPLPPRGRQAVDKHSPKHACVYQIHTHLSPHQLLDLGVQVGQAAVQSSTVRCSTERIMPHSKACKGRTPASPPRMSVHMPGHSTPTARTAHPSNVPPVSIAVREVHCLVSARRHDVEARVKHVDALRSAWSKPGARGQLHNQRQRGRLSLRQGRHAVLYSLPSDCKARWPILGEAHPALMHVRPTG